MNSPIQYSAKAQTRREQRAFIQGQRESLALRSSSKRRHAAGLLRALFVLLAIALADAVWGFLMHGNTL